MTGKLFGKAALCCCLVAAPMPTYGQAPDASIRKLDFRQYLIEKNDLRRICKDFSESDARNPIHFLEVEYADLDHDGKEEAVVEAASCAMGTGGADITAVYRSTSRGPVSLRITDEGYRKPDYRDEGMGSTPRLDVKDGQLVRWWIINAKRPRLPKSGWKKVIHYQWREDRFVVRAVDEIPPSD